MGEATEARALLAGGTRRAGPRAWTELTCRAALGRSVGRCGAVLGWVAEESWTGLPGFLGLGLVEFAFLFI